MHTVHLAVLYMLWKMMPCAEAENAHCCGTHKNPEHTNAFNARHENEKASFGIQALGDKVILRL